MPNRQTREPPECPQLRSTNTDTAIRRGCSITGPSDDQRFPLGRSTLSSWNSSGPFMSRCFRLAWPEPVAFRETPRRRAGRRRNPLRQHANCISLAVTIAGRLANGADLLRGRLRVTYCAMANAARFLTDELDHVLAREEGNQAAVLTTEQVGELYL